MAILDPPASLAPLPVQPTDVPWPTDEWPTGPVPDGVDAVALEALLGRAFGPDPNPGFGQSHATLVVHRGRLVVERYGPDVDATTPLLSWSMAKSVTHALVGILADQGRLDPHAPAAVPEWADPDDPRRAITLHQMLRMVDGLEFNEAYALPADGGEAAWSHCIDMLFGAGIADPAAYTATRPLAHEPGTVFNYSSGTTNLVARIVGDLIGRDDEARAWMHEHLFTPIGMTSADPTFDESGNFVGSSYLHANARDWARFGLLHLRGGEWDGRRIVSRGWVDDGRTTRARDDDGGEYGAHWWTTPDGRGRFYASGFEWQRVACVPTTDLVVVRLGKTAEDDYDTPARWFEELIAAFDTAS
jgi:CubicO group peptidase (beta-lactamase class C family)